MTIKTRLKKIVVSCTFAMSILANHVSVSAIDDEFTVSETNAENPVSVTEISESKISLSASIQLGENSEYEYDIVVNDEIVKVSVSNKLISRGSTIGSTPNQPIQQGQRYNTTITYSPLSLGTGKITYDIFYIVGEPISSSTGETRDLYKLEIYYLAITGTAPSGYSYSDSNAYISQIIGGGTRINTKGYITFNNVILPQLRYDVTADLRSYLGATTEVVYTISW